MRLRVVLFALCALVQCDECEGGMTTDPPASTLQMPDTGRLLTWDTFVSKVPSRTWTGLYRMVTGSEMGFLRPERTFVMTGADTLNTTVTVRVQGQCTTSTDTGLQHTVGDTYAVVNRPDGIFTEYFSCDPNSYLFRLACESSSIVDGFCRQAGSLTLMVPEFPPNQLNWCMVFRDLKYVMGITYDDPRLRFIAEADGCLTGPDRL